VVLELNKALELLQEVEVLEMVQQVLTVVLSFGGNEI
jgi:hypothetical protein